MSPIKGKSGFIFFVLPIILVFLVSCSCFQMGAIADPDLYLEINVTPLDEAQNSFSKQELSGIKAVMEKRIESLGAATHSVSIQGQNLIIKIKGYTDIEEVKSLLGNPGKLTFANDQGQIIVTGDHLKNVTYSMRETMEGGIQEPIIKLEFDDEGKRLLSVGTKQNLGRQITISLDEEPLMSPVVHDAIENGVVILTFGGPSMDAIKVVQQTATLLKGGAIPAVINIIKAETR